MTVVLKRPNVFDNKHRSPTVWKGRKKLGELSPRPVVKDDKLFAGEWILVLRADHRHKFPPTPETRRFFYIGKHEHMEIRYGTEQATYRLFSEPVVFGDGPPHPDHFQLAARIGYSGGVEEPQGAG